MKVAATCLALGMVILLLLPANSYATHKSEKLSWQLVFISSYSACSNYQYQMTNLYDEIAKNYLDLYRLENTNYKPVCITDKKYATNYHAPADLDLIILVYDRNLGRAELHSKQIGGFYYHDGNDTRQNHAIVFCDCPNFQYSDPVWILTHELSHFVLYYLNLDNSITEDYVHTLDAHYDYCIEVDHDADHCSATKIPLKLEHYAYSWKVMKPYVLSSNVTQLPDTSNLVDTKILKEITSWWATSKISDKDYWKIIMIAAGKENQTSLRDGNFSSFDSVLFTDPPKGMKEDLSSHTKSPEEKKLQGLLSRVPFENDSTKTEEGWIIPPWISIKAKELLDGQINAKEFLSIINPAQNKSGTEQPDSATSDTKKDIIYSYHWKRVKSSN